MEVMKQNNPGSNQFRITSNILKIPRIIGILDGNIVTLDQCVSSESFGFSMPGTAKCTVRVRRVFMGVGFSGIEPITINKMQFCVDGFNEWIGISGIGVTLTRNYEFNSLTYTPNK